MHSDILIIIEGQFQAFQRLSSSKLLLQTVESCFAALNSYKNGSSDKLESAMETAESLLVFFFVHVCMYIFSARSHMIQCVCVCMCMFSAHHHRWKCVYVYACA